MVQKVRKAVFPVAGLGTRFLPATKAMPKEMLTVVDKPVIQYAVEEALDAGIEEFIFVTGRGKSAIEDHFDKPYELADTLEKRGKIKELEAVMHIMPTRARIYYTRQGAPLGLGHAVHCAASITNDEPFAVLLPDDLLCTDVENPLSKMIQTYEETQKSVVLLEEVPHERTKNYGIADLNGAGIQNGRADVHGFVEKPAPQDAPSNLAVVGRYVFTSRIMEILATTKPGKGNEIQVTDAMDVLREEQGFAGYLSKSRRFDCGDKVGWQVANLYFALKDDYIGSRLQPHMHALAEQFDRRGEMRRVKEKA